MHADQGQQIRRQNQEAKHRIGRDINRNDVARERDENAHQIQSLLHKRRKQAGKTILHQFEYTERPDAERNTPGWHEFGLRLPRLQKQGRVHHAKAEQLITQAVIASEWGKKSRHRQLAHGHDFKRRSKTDIIWYQLDQSSRKKQHYGHNTRTVKFTDTKESASWLDFDPVEDHHRRQCSIWSGIQHG